MKPEEICKAYNKKYPHKYTGWVSPLDVVGDLLEEAGVDPGDIHEDVLRNILVDTPGEIREIRKKIRYELIAALAVIYIPGDVFFYWRTPATFTDLRYVRSE